MSRSIPHQYLIHDAAQEHHHHSHAQDSLHPRGHHLLLVEDLSVGFTMYGNTASAGSAQLLDARQRFVPIIDRLTVSVHAGEITAIVGASGSGKSLLANSLMGIFEPNVTVSGNIWFDGQLCDAARLVALRGNGISLVPQSISYLDPLMKVGKQVRGIVGRSGGSTAEGSGGVGGSGIASRPSRRRDAGPAVRQRQRQLFERYGLSPEVEGLYPHQLSGGMARRILLCAALMDEPRLIVADEPTPGLDLALACQVLEDFRRFANDGGGVLLITHDIELALAVADRVAVFNDGAVVEETAVQNFASPQTLKHQFSQALWHALPEHDFAVGEGQDSNC